MAQRSVRRVSGPARVGWAGMAALALAVAMDSPDGLAQAPPTLSVNDVTVNEGADGVSFATFTVSLDNPNGQTTIVSFNTNDGTATGSAAGRPFPSSGGRITIGDGPSSPYGVTIPVSGITGFATYVSLFVQNLTHPSPDDIDVVLVSADGRRLILVSDAGSEAAANNVSFNLTDYQPRVPDRLISGSYNPTNVGSGDVFPSPAPQGPYNDPPPAGTAGFDTTFAGGAANGDWKVWIVDDTPGGVGTVDSLVLFIGERESGSDFDHTAGVIDFQPGTTTRQVRVPIFGDGTIEPDETFTFDLGVVVNGVIGDGQGIGTIRNDDSATGPPIAVDDSYNVARFEILDVAAPGVQGNDNPNGGGPMTATLVTPPRNGRLLTFTGDGRLQYLANPGFQGVDTATYRVTNANGTSNDAIIFFDVRPAHGPTTMDDSYEVGQDRILRVSPGYGVLWNDRTNGGGTMTAGRISGPTNGQLTLTDDGAFDYTPNPGFSGTDRFSYRAYNEVDFSDETVVTVNVRASGGLYAPNRIRVENMRRHSTGTSTVTVRFDAPPTPPDPTHYEVAGGVLPRQTLARLFTNLPFPILRFEAPPGSFFIRALTHAGGLSSEPTDDIPLHNTTAVVPSAPENLLGHVNGSSLALAWTNTYGGGIPTNTILSVTGSLQLMVPLGVVAETFQYANVPDGTYTFQVLNATSAGIGFASNPVTLTFPGACSGPPEVPANALLISRETWEIGRRLTLGKHWRLPRTGPAPTSFVLDVVSPIFTGTIPVTEREVAAQVPPGPYEISVRVAGVNSCGRGPWTEFQTLDVRPEP